ncbi:MAG TPA: FtsW/RodA/SpoVE family cell cycle protein [Caldilineae bacterium]|nr:FtsW/RodA/SpoVE family cell cycle protein [Caldilineae bacterium]
MSRQARAQRGVDLALLAIVVSLLALGILSVYGASYAAAQRLVGDPTYFFSRQLIWALIGVVAMIVAASIDYSIWRQLAIPIMILALILLVLVLIIGEERFGARRTLLHGRVQPSELAKIAVIIYIAAWLASREKVLRDVRLGLIPFAVLLGLITLLIVAEPDISTSAVIIATAMTMFFIAGADLKQVGIAITVMAITFALLVTQSGYARDRVMAFWDFWQGSGHDSEKTYHTNLAIRMLMQGGWIGAGGPGASQLDPQAQIPLSWSDAILAIVGRDMGLIGTLLILGLFAGLMYRGFRIALHADDNFGTLLASGVTFWLVFQAIINVAVITAIIPFTGMPLPFISYGGSSMLAAMTGIGLLLSVSRGTRWKGEDLARLAFGRRDWGPRLSGARGRSRATRRSPRRNARSRKPRTKEA